MFEAAEDGTVLLAGFDLNVAGPELGGLKM